MGDILHALPAATALRSQLPDSWIGWAIEPQWEPLLRSSSAVGSERGSQMPVVDVLHSVAAKHWARNPLSLSTFREIKTVRDKLRRQRYDVCLDLQGAVRSAWIARMAATERVIGEANPREPLARWLFDERVKTVGVHVIDQAREVVNVLLTEVAEKPLLSCQAALPVDPEAEHWFEDWMATRNFERFVVMNPGAGWGAKRWPVERYSTVALELAALGYTTIVNVGHGESQLAAIICANNLHAFALHGSLGQLIACTRRASLFIGGDTGPLHLAAALRIPVVGIYGPTDPVRNGPYGTTATVLRHPDSQRDHTRRSEPEAGLLTITVEQVVESAKQLLQNSPTLAATQEGRSF